MDGVEKNRTNTRTEKCLRKGKSDTTHTKLIKVQQKHLKWRPENSISHNSNEKEKGTRTEINGLFWQGMFCQQKFLRSYADTEAIQTVLREKLEKGSEQQNVKTCEVCKIIQGIQISNWW